MKRMKQMTALLAAAVYGLTALGAGNSETKPTYPQNFAEYEALLESCPDGYRNDGDSVYFINTEVSASNMSLVTSSVSAANVSQNQYGYVLEPETDGICFVSTYSVCEEIVNFTAAGQDAHFHYFYPVVKNYKITAEQGSVTVKNSGGYSLRSKKQISETIAEVSETAENSEEAIELVCFDVLADALKEAYPDSTYYYCANAELGEDAYITSMYKEYGEPESWLCLNLPKRESSERVMVDEKQGEVLSPVTFDDAPVFAERSKQLYCVRALQDGEMTVTADDMLYKAAVKNGIIRTFEQRRKPIPGDVNGDDRVNIFDLRALQKHLAGDSDICIQKENADLCADGVIDAYDLALLKQTVYKQELSLAVSDFTRLNWLMADKTEPIAVFPAGDTALIVMRVPAWERQDGCEIWWELMRQQYTVLPENAAVLKTGEQAYEGIGFSCCHVKTSGAGEFEVVAANCCVRFTADENGCITAYQIT